MIGVLIKPTLMSGLVTGKILDVMYKVAVEHTDGVPLSHVVYGMATTPTNPGAGV